MTLEHFGIGSYSFDRTVLGSYESFLKFLWEVNGNKSGCIISELTEDMREGIRERLTSLGITYKEVIRPISGVIVQVHTFEILQKAMPLLWDPDLPIVDNIYFFSCPSLRDGEAIALRGLEGAGDVKVGSISDFLKGGFIARNDSDGVIVDFYTLSIELVSKAERLLNSPAEK